MKNFSLEVKGQISEPDEDVNPAIGKLEQFLNMVEWEIDPHLRWTTNEKRRLYILFYRNLSRNHSGVKLLPREPWLLNLPREWGGYNFQFLTLEEAWELTPDWYR